MAERSLRRLAVTLACLVLATLSPDIARADPAELEYDLKVTVDFTAVDRERDCVPVRLRVRQEAHLLRRLSWRPRPSDLDIRGTGFEAGRDNSEKRHVWELDQDGGRLDYCVVLNHRRSEAGGYDARLKKDWAVFRGDDLVPPARAVSRKGARSDTRLVFKLPDRWSATTRYPTSDFRTFEVRDPERGFDRPTGWMAAGRLTRWINEIADTWVLVSGPRNQGFQSMEVLVLLGYTLGSVRQYFPEFPDRLAIIGAGGDMWRGALSGPGSMFIHADRPLVSGNATSTLLHELGHIGLGRRGAAGADWIVEGLVEFLSAHILHETGGLADKRYSHVMTELREWSRDAEYLDTRRSSGPVTARAVLVFADLHAEMGAVAFESLVTDLADGRGPVTLAELRSLAAQQLGHEAKSLLDLPLKEDSGKH